MKLFIIIIQCLFFFWLLFSCCQPCNCPEDTEVFSSLIFNFIYINDGHNENWITIPFNESGINNTDDLILDIADTFTPIDNDLMVVTIRDNENQVFLQGMMEYNGSSWNSLGSIPLSVGQPCSVVLSNSGGRPVVQTQWLVSGFIPESVNFPFVYIDEAHGENWMSLPFQKSEITDTEQLVLDMFNDFDFINGDIIAITLRDNVNQVFTNGGLLYNDGVFNLGTQDISVGTPFSVLLSNPERSGVIEFSWP